MGSNPISSTILQKGTSSAHRGSNRFVPGRRRFDLSGCHGESLCAKPWSTLVRTLPCRWLESLIVTANSLPPARQQVVFPATDFRALRKSVAMRADPVDPSSLVPNRSIGESIDAKRLARTPGLSRRLLANQCPRLIPTRWQSPTHTRCRGHCEYACGEKRNTSAQTFPFAAVCLWTCPHQDYILCASMGLALIYI